MFFTAEGEEGTVPPWRATEVFLGKFGRQTAAAGV
jgi:hypothetical protein